MAEIISIATEVPKYCHRQKDIIHFMSKVYGLDEIEKRKLSFLYNHSGIETRYSVIDDYSQPEELWDFIPHHNENGFPSLEARMRIYDKEALVLSLGAIQKCIDGIIKAGIFKNAQEFKDFLDFHVRQQFIEEDYSDYEFEFQARGFNEIQQEAMYDFDFWRFSEWESAIDEEAGIFDSTLIGGFELTKEGVRVHEELEKILSVSDNGDH